MRVPSAPTDLAFFILGTNITAFQLLGILMVCGCGCIIAELFYGQISRGGVFSPGKVNLNPAIDVK